MRLPNFYIKKLDWFIIKSFLQLFVGTFFICLFVLIMQFLWRWVDEFVGKGLDMSILIQFFYYSSLSMVGQALPLAILLSSLMTFGNFGERLELLSMKAAGIPLLRVMAPLVIVSLLLGCASFYFQNVIGPNSQVKLYTVLYSVKHTSPELEIPEGVFYDQIEGYNLFVKKKNKKTGTLYRVMIYDISRGFENATILVADSGRMESTPDQKHLLLHLYSGEQFSNVEEQQMNKKSVPYRREMFREKTVVIEFDSGFDMQDGSFLKTQAASKNMIELAVSIDSMSAYIDSIGRNYWSSAMRSAYPQIPFQPVDSATMEETRPAVINIDSIYTVAQKTAKLRWKKAGLSKIEQQKTDYEIKNNVMHSMDKDINRHRIEWWKKITLSLACFVFFLIGAPLGAIVKKGGLGYPVLMSVAIFVFYYIFDTSGSKLAREGEWHVWFGSWINTLILVPLGVILTYQSNRDSTVFNMDAYKAFFRSIIGLRESRHVTLKEVIIEDPDYSADIIKLDDIKNSANYYRENNTLKRTPNPMTLFFSNNQDNAIDELSEKLESLINEMGNSKNKKIIQSLNNFPILMVNAIHSPFNKRWLNIISLILLPLGMFIYLRMWRFRFQLSNDLLVISDNCNKIKELLIKEKLV